MMNVKIEYNKMGYLFDTTLSLKAKGVMATMIAYINKNSPLTKLYFTLDDVREMSCDGKTAFSNAINELKAKGYMEMRANKGGEMGIPWYFILKE